MLVSWGRFFIQVSVGLLLDFWAYEKLIIPKDPLMPDFRTAGNEIWLAISAFIYAIINKVHVSSGPTSRRKNKYIANRLANIKLKYDNIFTKNDMNDIVKLVCYSIILYEGYNRPKILRFIERMSFPFFAKTTGEMQISSDKALSDRESVVLGCKNIASVWQRSTKKIPEGEKYKRVKLTISSHNRDDDYVSGVIEIMELIACRADLTLKPAYDSLWE